MKKASAYANANIALVKYWGKSDHQKNIPAVSSLSMTLDGLGTTVHLSPSKRSHCLTINGQHVQGAEYDRLSGFLEKLRQQFPFKNFLAIESLSTVPVAAGLASSASFFAALCTAFNEALGLELNKKDLSGLAREGSASAARSIFDGFSGLYGGSITHEEAHAFSIDSSLKLGLLIAVVSKEKKALSSREAMNRTEKSSDFYKSFVATHHEDFSGALSALAKGSFAHLGEIMEHSTLKMHASMWVARPSINYLKPASLALIELVYAMRKVHGPIVYFTMDAGPNVKLFCEERDLTKIRELIQQSPIVDEIILSKAGAGAKVISP